MGQVWLYSLLSILIVSAISLVGILFLLLKKDLFGKIQTLLVSFAIGSLLGGAILHLIPESLNNHHSQLAPLLVLFSILVFFILEKYLHFHRHHYHEEKNIKSFGPLNLIADAMHNFLDGILVATAYSIDIHTGVIATIAILAHEIPQEIGDFAVLVQAGYTKKRALFFNFLSALSALVGGVVVLAFPVPEENLKQYILPLAAGGFIYIALADLVPELNVPQSAKKAIGQVVAVILGLLMMWLLLDNHSLHH
jgi:zinc and cadmium transporter